MCGTSRNFIDIDYASSKLGRKTPSTLPPLEFTELHRLPPSKSGRKTPSTTPPLEFTELHRLPPLEIGPENSFNYPPLEFTELHRLPLSSPELVERTGTLPCESVPTVKNSHFNHCVKPYTLLLFSDNLYNIVMSTLNWIKQCIIMIHGSVKEDKWIW